jgi:hypothetical protein
VAAGQDDELRVGRVGGADQRASGEVGDDPELHARSCAAEGVALVATALAQLLIASTPRPLVFFSWIVDLATVVAVVYPFSTAAPLSAKAATAAVDLVIGVVIGSLVSGVAARSARGHQASDKTVSYTPGREIRDPHAGG